MAVLGVVTINGKQILVETDSAAIPSSFGVLPPDASGALPRGAEFTGLDDRLRDAGRMIKDTVGAFAETAIEALRGASPDECSVEISIGFKGESHPIPVIVKLGGEASVKVTATWKKLPALP